MAFNIDKLFGIHQHAMNLRSRRAGLLAANLANSDTPNYKARDLDFQAELKKLQANMNTTASSGLKTTQPGHISGTNDGFSTEVIYRQSVQPSLDGNTVDTHAEHSAFMQNALNYQASLRFLNGSIQSMMTALKGE